MRRLEFWPDYGGVLLHEGGVPVALSSLSLPPDLVAEAVRWVARYGDERLEPDTRDDAWIEAGRALFQRLRGTLTGRATEIVDWEGYWDATGASESGSP